MQYWCDAGSLAIPVASKATTVESMMIPATVKPCRLQAYKDNSLASGAGEFGPGRPTMWFGPGEEGECAAQRELS